MKIYIKKQDDKIGYYTLYMSKGKKKDTFEMKPCYINLIIKDDRILYTYLNICINMAILINAHTKIYTGRYLHKYIYK